MLSKKAEKKLQQLEALLRQRDEINRQIEGLLLPVIVPVEQPESLPEQPAPKRKGYHHGSRIVPEFTDAQIEKMIRESDEGKTARQMMQEYGFKSTSNWYFLKSKYKKQHKQSTADDDTPDYDAADDEEEPEDEPVVEQPSEAARVARRYDYQCSCG